MLASSGCDAAISSHVSSASSDLRRAGRARIERGDAVQFGVHEEERHAHRDLQRVPLGDGELEVWERAIPVRNRAEVPPACATAREEQVTTTTRAHEVARV
jgi:hypothetical protein